MGKKTWGVEFKKEFDRKFQDCLQATSQPSESSQIWLATFMVNMVCVAKLKLNLRFNISRLPEIRKKVLIFMLGAEAV